MFHVSEIQIINRGNAMGLFDFDAGAFATPGTYPSLAPASEGAGTFIVSAVSAVPELPNASLVAPILIVTFVRRNSRA